MDKKMQKLHQRLANGEKLTATEKASLKKWYEANDRQEDILLNQGDSGADPDLREKLSALTRQIAKTGGEIEKIAEQNAKLRRENRSLRRAFESSLVEKAA